MPRSIFSSGWRERAVQNSPVPMRTVPFPPASISSVTTALSPVIPRCPVYPSPPRKASRFKKAGRRITMLSTEAATNPTAWTRDPDPEQGRNEPDDGAKREEEQEERDGKKLPDEGKSRQNGPENDLQVQVSCLLEQFYTTSAAQNEPRSTPRPDNTGMPTPGHPKGARMTIESERDLAGLAGQGRVVAARPEGDGGARRAGHDDGRARRRRRAASSRVTAPAPRRVSSRASPASTASA